MKRMVPSSYCIAAILFYGLAELTLCGESPNMSGAERFKVVSVRRGDLMHEAWRHELYYVDESGKQSLIWGFLANQMLYTNDLALFHGYLTTGPGDPGGATRATVQRLFAANGRGPVVDITDDVVKIWADSSGTNFFEVVQSRLQRVREIEKSGDHFAIKVSVIKGGHGTVELTPSQIIGLIQAARNKGKQMKDPGLKTPYLKRDWETELRKP